MQFENLKYSVDDGVALIVFDRPDAANGLNLAMATDLSSAAEMVANDSTIKAVVLSAVGRFFCAGGDVKAMAEASQPGAAVAAIAEQLHRAIKTFAGLDAPVICAVNGTAAGAGFSLAVSADLVVAAEGAKFTMAYSNIGLSPDGSASYFLPRLIGLRKTQELMFTNRVLSAKEALEWGLVTDIVSNDTVLERANSMAANLAKGSKGSHAAIKQLLALSGANSLNEQLDLERDTIAKCADSIDGKEGVSAFIEKRKPTFQ